MVELSTAQEVIYSFLIDLVKQQKAAIVLTQFKQLFIEGGGSLDSNVSSSIYEILFRKDENIFRSTLKRSCYILVNNWSLKRDYSSIKALIDLLSETIEKKKILLSRSKHRLQIWIENFVNSQDYQDLKLFSLTDITPETTNKNATWSYRYAPYLLVAQSLISDNPIEQREVARNLARQLKQKFRFDLAMYVARCKASAHQQTSVLNPTMLGDSVIHLIKKIVPRHLLFNYTNYAHIFTQQIKILSYHDFKQSFKRYLIFYLGNQVVADILKEKLSLQLDPLYQDRDRETVTVNLLLRTCRKTIDFLTAENDRKPAQLFILLAAQGNPLTIVILLLKIVLICTYVRTHLDVRIANLIRYYEQFPDEECQWFIDFLEMFNVVFAIYTGNVRYDLVKTQENLSKNYVVVNPENYRIFPQLKGTDLRGADFSGTDLANADLNDADLRNADLHGADLTQADLSLARLNGANLSGVRLHGAKLIVADLKGANLRRANLSGADLHRAVLKQANLVQACLTAADLHRADFRAAQLQQSTLERVFANHTDWSQARLQQATLQSADLSQAILEQANLAATDLSRSNLSASQMRRANLSGANLAGADLSGADLSHACLVQATLNCANLDRTNLNQVNGQDALFCRASLKQASLQRANLQGAICNRADLSRSNLSEANLSSAMLRHVNFRGANLSGANLKGANLFGADLSNANLKQAQLQNISGLSDAEKQQLVNQGAVIDNFAVLTQT